MSSDVTNTKSKATTAVLVKNKYKIPAAEMVKSNLSECQLSNGAIVMTISKKLT